MGQSGSTPQALPFRAVAGSLTTRGGRQMNCSPTHAPHVALEREYYGTKAEAMKSNLLVGSADHESLSLTMRTVELPTWLGPPWLGPQSRSLAKQPCRMALYL